jgi:membrane protease YdiL (CAAX protease family)
MALLISAFISTAVQLAAALLLCGLAYLFVRQKHGFRAFIGLYAAPARIVLLGCLIGLASASLLMTMARVRAVAGGPGTVIAGVVASGLGPSTLASLCLLAVFKTAVAEEILFRGLIAKRLIAWCGFAVGNFLQAILFGLVHLLLLLTGSVDPVVVAALYIFAGALGWITGWLNERRAAGSILPGIGAHACANLLTYLSIPFLFHGT